MRYRVRVQRKDCQRDEHFTDLAEAVQFLALTKTKSGREMLSRHEETKEQEALEKQEQEMFDTIAEMGLDKYHFIHSINLYKKDYIETIDISEELDKEEKQTSFHLSRQSRIPKCHMLSVGTTSAVWEFTRKQSHLNCQ